MESSCSISERCRCLGTPYGPHTFVAFGKKIIGFHFSARAGDPAQTGDQDSAPIDSFSANQRPKRNQNTCRITTGAGDQFRVPDLVPINFRQSVNGLAKQFRRGMIVAVKFLVNRGVAEPKIGAEIDNARARIPKAVWQTPPRDPCGRARKMISASRASCFRIGIGKVEDLPPFSRCEKRGKICCERFARQIAAKWRRPDRPADAPRAGAQVLRRRNRTRRPPRLWLFTGRHNAQCVLRLGPNCNDI